jgi:hypothetical protein
MKRRTVISSSALIACFSLLAGPLDAQDRRVSLEGRLGTTLPAGSLSDRGAESGLLAEGELIFTPSLDVSVFAGLGVHSFNCDEEDCDEFSSHGLHGGVKYLFSRSGSATPWVRGGLLLHEAERDAEDSGFTVGFEAGGGIDLAVTPRFTLAPSLRYHRYEADFGNDMIDMSWFSLALGAHIHFF